MSTVNSNNRRRQAEELYQRALDLPVDRRDQFLKSECRDDGLRLKVHRLLGYYDTAGSSFLDHPAHMLSSAADVVSAPERIGRYHVVRLIGEGGMGTVYEAEQTNPKRRVAVKVIRADRANEEVLSRFQREVDALARLGHPGIAQIYEAGVAEIKYNGQRVPDQPFFAMELVRGEPVKAYAQDRQLATGERLGLVACICDAVHHAHQKGVIHRDLKPGNILVDASGQPKILDFGVARAIDADLQRFGMQTAAGKIIGTVPYMSPEQVMGDSRQVDTRSDVYALAAR